MIMMIMINYYLSSLSLSLSSLLSFIINPPVHLYLCFFFRPWLRRRRDPGGFALDHVTDKLPPLRKSRWNGTVK
jgi:hypothetical protein